MDENVPIIHKQNFALKNVWTKVYKVAYIWYTINEKTNTSQHFMK